MMGEQPTSRVERLVRILHQIEHRIEEHVEEWRKQERARQAEVRVQREKLWAEARERERLLAEAIAEEEAGRISMEEITKQQRVVFVVHSEEIAQALDTLAQEGDRLVSVVPGRGSYGGGTGIKGSWLVFETKG